VAWTGATTAAIASSPSVANGVVYVGSNDGKLYAFAVGCATGGGACSPIWTATTGGAIDASPAASGKNVFVTSSDGKLYAFAIGCGTGGATCSPLWTATTGGPIHSSPSVDLGVVYVGSNDGKLYAFDSNGIAGCSGTPKVCTPVWTATTGGAIESSPAGANGDVYVGSDDGKLYAFAVGCSSGGGTCLPLWTATTGGAIHSSPATLATSVYVGSLDGKLYAFDGLGVSGCTAGVCLPLWTATTGGAIYSSPSVGDGRVWVGSDDGKVYSFHASCGSGGAICPALWTGDTGHPIRSSPGTAHDVLYVGSSDGKLYAFDADCATATCLPSFSSTIGTSILSSPAITNGVVYVGSDDHKLYAFHLLIDHLVLSPAGATIVAGSTQGFAAEGFDSLSTDLGDVTAGTIFTISTGGTCTLNQCGSITGGDYTVTGTDGTAVGSTTLHVSLSGSTYVALTPTRLLDTRVGNGLSGVFTSQVARTFTVAGRGGVPGGALAVTGNLTVTGQTALGFLFIGPAPINNPTSSTLNFPVADDRANAVTVALGGGSLSVTYFSTLTTATTHVIFDVTGYFLPDASGAYYFPLTPARLLDSRTGNGISGVFQSQVSRPFQVSGRGGVDPLATAVTGNLTVTQQTAKGFIYLGPDVTNNPTSSTLNFPVGDDRANAVTVALSPGGKLNVTYFSTLTTATAHVIFDVTGYFIHNSAGATFVPLPPTRILDTRTGVGLSGVFPSQQNRHFVVAGHGGSSPSTLAITGNLTVTAQTDLGFLFMGPNQINIPTSSTLNFPVADDRANAVTVALAGDGSIAITYYSTNVSATTHVVFDLTGYFIH
jgi:outer membrane protein assembly factor BamB